MALINLTGTTFGSLTVLARGADYVSPAGSREPTWTTRCACGQIADRRGSHLREGRATSCGCAKRVDKPSYQGAHNRVRRSRGLPSAHTCAAGCGRQAQDWAYDHADPNELQGPRHSRRRIITSYSADPAHYVPLCRSCHALRDKGVQPW